jgi:hypothetical protein
MSYADTMLAPGEHVIVRQRQHWLALILDSRLAILLWALAIVAVIIRFLVVPEDRGWIANGLVTIGGIAFVLGLIVLVYRWLKWRADEFLVTNRRLLNVTGIINKRSADSSLEKINDAVLEVNLLGRWLDYGDLDILTAADSGIDRYRMLNHATAFKKAMLTAKHALETDTDGVRRPAPAAAPGTPATGATRPPSYAAGGKDPLRADTPEEVTQLLERLGEMRDAGHISPEEYAAKKQELMDRL